MGRSRWGPQFALTEQVPDKDDYPSCELQDTIKAFLGSLRASLTCSRESQAGTDCPGEVQTMSVTVSSWPVPESQAQISCVFR